MSLQAITWAFYQDLSRSSLKFLLVAYANYADLEGVCFPSQARLSRDTGQDRKTIMANVKALIDLGLLRDTGMKIGPTKSVAIMQIVGLPEQSKVHYVYRTSRPDTGEFYIGKRSFDGDPAHDIYRGSGKWVSEMMDEGAVLAREVLAVFETSEEAAAAEIKELRRVESDPLCKNIDTPLRRKQQFEARQKFWNQKQYQKRDFFEDVPKTALKAVPKRDSKRSQKRYIEPIYNHQRNPKKDSLNDWPLTYREDFWNAYPRHVEKKAALAKLEALKKSGEVKWQELIAGVMRYASAVAQTEVKYIKHPTTWLNRGCWSDEARAIAAKPAAKKLSFFDIALGRIEHDDERAKPH